MIEMTSHTNDKIASFGVRGRILSLNPIRLSMLRKTAVTISPDGIVGWDGETDA